MANNGNELIVSDSKQANIVYVKHQVCQLSKEELKADGLTLRSHCEFCLDDGVYCRVGNHKNRDELEADRARGI